MTYEHTWMQVQCVARRSERELGVTESTKFANSLLRNGHRSRQRKRGGHRRIDEDVAKVLAIAVEGDRSQSLRMKRERQPLSLTIRLPVSDGPISIRCRRFVFDQNGSMVPLAEIGEWRESSVGQTIYHKNLRRVVYVDAETVGRPRPNASWIYKRI